MAAKLIGQKDSLEHIAVMEIDSAGKLSSYTLYYVEDQWCEDAVRSFQKVGKFFMLTGCGHGSGYGTEYRYIFDHIVPEEQLPAIYLSSFVGCGSPHDISSTMQVTDTAVIVDYFVKKGQISGDSLRWGAGKNVDITYTWKHSSWQASDSTALADLEME